MTIPPAGNDERASSHRSIVVQVCNLDGADRNLHYKRPAQPDLHQHIIAAAITAAAVEIVIPARALDGIIAAAAFDGVVAACADQRVVARAAEELHRHGELAAGLIEMNVIVAASADGANSAHVRQIEALADAVHGY